MVYFAEKLNFSLSCHGASRRKVHSQNADSLRTGGQRREELSLEELLIAIQPRIRVLFARYRVPVEEGEDILQQALLALVIHGERVFNREAWLLGTLRKRSLLYWRRQRKALHEAVDPQLLELLAPSIQPPQEHDDLRRDLERLIGGLPLRCRRFFHLRYREGVRFQEIGFRLGYRQVSVGKLSGRCMSQLLDRARRLGIRWAKG